jgi:hypothetical protein
VLWIRIRNNPNVLAGSESEKKFGFGYGFGIRHKNPKSNTWKRKILCFSIENFFSSDVQVSEHIRKQLEAPFRKIWGQNISLRIRIRIRIRIRKKKFVDPNPKKMSSDPQHCFKQAKLNETKQISLETLIFPSHVNETYITTGITT